MSKKISIDKVAFFASKFDRLTKLAVLEPGFDPGPDEDSVSGLVTLEDYINKGLFQVPAYLKGKRAHQGYSLGGVPYPPGYVGGYNEDGSGLPPICDDDVKIEPGMTAGEVQNWFVTYIVETDPSKLVSIASKYKKFPTAAKYLLVKAQYIKANTK